MADNLIPESEQEECSNNAPPDEKAGDRCPQNSKKDFHSPHGNELIKPESMFIVNALLFAIIEAVAFILWQIADGLTGYVCVFVHWLSLVCISAGPLPAARRALKREKRIWFWSGCTIVWVLLAVVAHIVWRPKEPGPKPHFVLSLRVGDSAGSVVFLTNEFLSDFQVSPISGNETESPLHKVAVSGCLIIPLQPGQSNMVFKFIAENDSPVKVNDLQIAIAFPKDWACLADSKWHSIEWSLQVPELFTMDPTNIDVWAMQVPWVLRPGDMMRFPPITNPCVVPYIGPESKAGMVAADIRSTEFRYTVAANIIFYPRSSSFTKPFVTEGYIDSRGKLNISLLPINDLERSVKPLFPSK